MLAVSDGVVEGLRVTDAVAVFVVEIVGVLLGVTEMVAVAVVVGATDSAMLASMAQSAGAALS
jgi:hypothetical protein